MRFFAGCVLSAFLGGLMTVWMAAEPRAEHLAAADGTAVIGSQKPDRKAPAVPLTPVDEDPQLRRLFNADGLTPEEALNVAVYERVHRSVVNITTKSVRAELFFAEALSEGSGSGSVIDHDGHILTNWHVVADSSNINVTLFNGDTHEAKLVGYDPPNDIAIIRIEAAEDVLHPITLGDSSHLKVGMRVLAIGNPFELERTLTTGIVSSLNRSLQVQDNWTIKSIIQIDAAINPGNSGGPLIDLHGRLIGMNTAIASRTGQSAGVGFAIPVNLVTRVVPDLITHGRVHRPEVGIQKVFETEEGLLVERLTPGGPAELAGIRGPTLVRQKRGPFVFERQDRSTADLIIAVDDKPVSSVADFRDAVESRKPGDTITLTVVRGRENLNIRVKLGGGPPEKSGGTRL